MNPDQTTRYYPPNTDLSFDAVSPEEERELFQRARRGDEASRNTIIENHLLFVANEARKMVKGRLPDNDVVSAANLALMKAVDRFDWKLGNRFTSYLRLFIKGEIVALWKSTCTDCVPLDFSDCPGAEADPNPTSIEGNDYQSFLRRALEHCKGELSTKERSILTLHYNRGLSFAEIARRKKCSREWIRLSHNSALEKLKKLMGKFGVTSSQ